MAADGGGHLNLDTVMSSKSYEVALMAAGGAMLATEAILSDKVQNAFALIRPPGHHAGPNYGAGFCLFNNIAIAVRHAQRDFNLRRILIADYDTHHGNGTQDIFYEDSSALYLSIHQSPLYPGTGQQDEVGLGEGKGYTINMPLPPGSGDVNYTRTFKEVLLPAARRFRPEMIFVSVGYDAHWADSIANMNLSVAGYAQLSSCLRQLADELCHGRLLFCLEGGYNLKALAASVIATLKVISNQEAKDPIGPNPQKGHEPDIAPAIQRAKQLHNLS
jgi:acetoin utilization deacetylase AcuC-like enzyme